MMLRRILAFFGLALKKDLDESDAAIVLWRGAVFFHLASIELIQAKLAEFESSATTDNMPRQ